MSEVFDTYLLTDKLEFGTIVMVNDEYDKCGHPVFNTNTLLVIVSIGWNRDEYYVANVDSTLPDMQSVKIGERKTNIKIKNLKPYSFELWKEKTGRDVDIPQLNKFLDENLIESILIHNSVAPKIETSTAEETVQLPELKNISSSYVLTTEEKEELYNEIMTVLEKYGYNPEPHAVAKIIEEWVENKGYLINLFKEHPYYNGKFQIAFSNDFERKIDFDVVHLFADWIVGYDVRRELNDEEMNILFKLKSFLKSDYVDITLSETFATEINNLLPEVKLAAGMKTSRAINKICTTLGIDKAFNYNREFAKCSDGLNPLKIKRHTVLSVHPVDYLLMSNGNSWSSCHLIGVHNDGCYSGGTISYMLDRTSMVFYTVDAKAPEDKLELEKKINRNMFFYDNKRLVQSRLYPQSCDYGCKDMYDDFRHIVQRIITTCLDTPNFWKIKRGRKACKNAIVSGGVEYQDWIHFSNVNISTLKAFANEEFKHIYVGVPPICPECGCEHENEESILCYDCNDYNSDYYSCTECGCDVYYEDVYEVNGDYYCGDCVSYCDYHERYEVIRYADMYKDGYGNCYCKKAIEEADYLYLCDKCDSVINTKHNKNAIIINDKVFCDCDCASDYGYISVITKDKSTKLLNTTTENYYYCEDCEEYFSEDAFDKKNDRCIFCQEKIEEESLAKAS